MFNYCTWTFQLPNISDGLDRFALFFADFCGRLRVCCVRFALICDRFGSIKTARIIFGRWKALSNKTAWFFGIPTMTSTVGQDS